jgi:hypothetical protein
MKSHEIMMIPLDQIKIGERLRPVDQDAVLLIAGSMGNDPNGQLVPIKVRAIDGTNFELIAGAHRIAAAKMMGFQEIRAELFEGTAEDALVCEIDENLCRAELSAADQAVFLHRKLELFEADGKKLRRGRDLRKSAKLAHLDPEEKKRFYKMVERQIGVPRRTTQRALHRARNVPPAVMARMTGKERDDGSLLDKIAKIEIDQPGALEKLLAERGMAVRAAVRQFAETPAPDAERVGFAEFAKAWRDEKCVGHKQARAAVRKWLASRGDGQ